MAAEDGGADWELLPGLGVKLSERSMPIPDILVRPAVRISGHDCDDMIAAFEIQSPSSRKRELQWKRDADAALPSLQHYVVLHQDRAEARCFDRAAGWVERRVAGAGGRLDLAAPGVSFDLMALYAGTGVT